MSKAADRAWQVLLRAVDRAREGVAGGKVISGENAHDARKSLKMARAALRLLRPAIGDIAYRREDTALRDASRSIAPLRDADAQAELIAAFRQRCAESSASEWMLLEAKARRRLARVRRTLKPASPHIRAGIVLMKASRRRLGALSRATADADDVDASLRKIYRRLRRGLGAAQRRPTTATLHAWRKKAKYFVNAVDVLGRHASSKAATLAATASCLADGLGEDHDLAVLAETVRRNAQGLKPRGRVRVRRAIAARRAKLRRNALDLGGKLRDARPKDLA